MLKLNRPIVLLFAAAAVLPLGACAHGGNWKSLTRNATEGIPYSKGMMP